LGSERQRLSGGRHENLIQRAQLLRVLREFLDGHGFIEIDAPILVPSPGLELHLDAFACEGQYLITSPEYQMKRLLAGGMERIYSLGKVFRRGELGLHHNPEFTMLEWYRANAGWEVIADDLEQMVRAGAQAIGGPAGIDLEPPWMRMTVGEACERWARVRVYGDETPDDLRRKMTVAGLRVPADGDFSDLFFTMFLDAVEPHLPNDRPILLHDWPRPLCALAREKPADQRVVERFEVYVAGVELCNAFGELTDAAEQRRRLEADLAERRRRGLPAYPIDEKFLAAVAQLPPCSGIALGVDRLAMVLLGVGDIRDVVPFTMDEL
jgi:lysyl-tRNA synthetase class 2